MTVMRVEAGTYAIPSASGLEIDVSTMKVIDTQRQYGEKRDEAHQKLRFEGVSLTVTAKDFWEGPCAPGEHGYWKRGYFISGD